ncbi:MAG: outer membrane protein assembly factor BamD [Oligoflexales bacterium]|nr:outer membrane protein assembly factor BamD [Oligoflexales bacterium]
MKFLKNLASQLSIFLTVALAFSCFPACSEKEFDPTDPQKSFVVAKEYFDDGNYEIGIQKLREFKARFPYSQYTAEAELLIADSHYNLSQFIEAASAYEQFAKLHPKHKKVDYALYRQGQSYWSEAPEEVDREQVFTESAIDAWKQLLERFPESTYAKEVGQLVATGTRRIADSYNFVAKFYCKMEIWHACAYRNTKIVNDYSQFKDLALKASLEAAKALDLLANEKAKDMTSDKNVYFRDLTPEKLKSLAAGMRKKSEEFK